MLKVLAVGIQHLQRLFFLPLCANDTDEDMGVLQIGSDVNGANRNQGSLEFHLATDDDSKFPLEEFADPDKTEIHGKGCRE